MSLRHSGFLRSSIVYYLAAFMPRFLSTSAYSYKQPVFSTKTPYDWVLKNRDVNNNVLENQAFEGCSPVHLNFVIRHGARQPGMKDVNKFSDLGSKVINQLLTSKEYKLHPLMQWKNRFIGNDKELAELGRKEQHDFGSRLGKQYKNLLTKFGSKGLHFEVSSKSRTKDSAVSFYNGIMPELDRDITSEEGMIISLSDESLRFFDNCEKYIKDVDNNKTALKEFSKFLESNIMMDLADKVTGRLEMRDVTISPAEVRTIYYLCGIETAFYGSSDWCIALEEDDLPIMEYLMDLKQYWKKAYGYDINYLQSCPLTEDIFSSIKEAVKKYTAGEEYVTGLFRFAHAETILPLYAMLQLYKDYQPLLANNYQQQKNRKFFSSLICPFSANIGFVIYDCKSRKAEDRFYVSVQVNEQPIRLPDWNDLLCPLSKFQQIYSNISGCNFSDVCLNDLPETSRDEL